MVSVKLRIVVASIIVLIGSAAVLAGFVRQRHSVIDTAGAGNSHIWSVPLFVLIEYNPWAMVMGSDSPTFALYEDGKVIYRERNKPRGGGKYLIAQLSQAERARLVDKINPRAFNDLKGNYSNANYTDAPTYLMMLHRADGSDKGVSIYGSRLIPGNSNRDTSQLPRAITNAFQLAMTYVEPNAKEWLPDYIEVMIWPYEYASDRNMLWPKGWPTLRDPKTVKRRDGAYSLFVEKAHYREIAALLANLHEKQAVQIDGRKWAISTRIPFPNEARWFAVRQRLNGE